MPSPHPPTPNVVVETLMTFGLPSPGNTYSPFTVSVRSCPLVVCLRPISWGMSPVFLGLFSFLSGPPVFPVLDLSG